MKLNKEQLNLGFGVGLRKQHVPQIWTQHEGVDFFEILSDNFMGLYGWKKETLQKAKEIMPIIMHGVGLNIGGIDPLNQDYLTHLKALIDFIDPPYFSDHLCYTSAFGVEYHDLIPLVFQKEVANHVSQRIQQVEDYCQKPFVIENPSYYMVMPESKMTEIDFINEVLMQSHCGLLLDINNVYVNAMNHGYDPYQFIDQIPPDHVFQYHIAGHFKGKHFIIDTHGDFIIEEVFELFQYTWKTIGPRSTLLEWDNDVPALNVLLEENMKVRQSIQSIPISVNDAKF